MALTLDYNDAAHEYRLGGIVIPSVTQALKLAGLIDTRYYTPEAAARGSAVHAATALCDGSQDQSLASVIGRCDQNIENYVEAYWAFLFDTGIVYSDIERRRAHDELRYAGCTDRRVLNLNGEQGVFEIKTGDEADWHGVQLALYQLLFPTGTRWALYLKPNGKYRGPVRMKNADDYRTGMRAVLDAHEALRRVA